MDIYYSSNSLLLHGNGTDGSTTIVDNSPTPAIVTATGSAVISTTQSKFGGASLKTNSGAFTSPNAARFGFGTGDFTVEFFVRPATNSGTVSAVSITHSGVVFRVSLVNTGGTPMHVTVYNAATLVTTNNATPLDQWTHIAVVRSSGMLTLFVNGVGSTPVAFSTDIHASGSISVGDGFLVSYLDEVRITKGVARYTSTFDVPTLPFDDGAPSYASLTAPLATLEFTASPTTAHGDADLSPAAPIAAIFGGASSQAVSPSATLASFSGAWARDFTGPSPTLLSLGHDSTGENAANLTAPSPTLEITTGANSRLTAPTQTLTATGTVTILATATLVAPKATLSAAGTVSGMATASLSAPRPNLIGYGGAVCSISVTGNPTLLATGTTGSIGGVQATCPLFELTASGTAQNYGSADLIAPSPALGLTAQAWLTAPSAQLTAIGSAVVAVTYEAYVVNLLEALDTNPRSNYEAKVPETTRYTNFPFTHVIRHQGSYYGANSTGLYLLEGTTDDGVDIPFAVKTCETDFDSPQLKTVESAYFAGRIGNAETVTLYAREETTHAMSFTTPRNTKPQSHRQVFPRGEKARYFAVGISGTKEFELDTIDLSVGTTKRRI